MQKDLEEWFGKETVAGWNFMRLYRIPFTLPTSSPPVNRDQSHSLGDGLYICGDHRTAGTLHDALMSGRKVAEAVLAAALVTSPVNVNAKA
jgi:predicted NAD/FAD-dependent oxidoreductase